MSYDPATAYNQGVNEANAAIDVAANLGLTLADKSGTIIYYDLEGYNTNDTACRNAAKSFISGWSAQLRARGNQAGVYGSSCASGINDFASISNVPDAVWPAYWIYTSYNSNATVWNVKCIPDGNWSNHQRIRQYAGGHNETWGGITLNIDSDVIDGIVANTGSGGSDTTDPDGDITDPSEGATINSRTVHLAGWASDSQSGFNHAHFTAYYNGSWRQVGPDFTSSPFGFDWDMCDAEVPDGPVTIACTV